MNFTIKLYHTFFFFLSFFFFFFFSEEGSVQKEEDFEITCCGIVCIGEILSEFYKHGRTECDRYQKGANSIALEHSRRKRA